MKRLLILPVLLACGMSLSAQMPSAPGMPSAATAGAPNVAPAKIAVIAFQVAVGKTNEFQRDFADVQKKYEPRRQSLKALSDQIDTQTRQLQAQGATLSDAERAQRAETIDNEKKKLDRDAQDAQGDFQQEVQTLYTNTASKVYDVLNAYAEQHGYTLVLDIATQQTPVMYALPSTDITQAIVDAYNVKSGVPAPPQPAAGAATTPHRPAAPKSPQH